MRAFRMAVGWSTCNPQARGLYGRSTTCRNLLTPFKALRALARTGSVMSWGRSRGGPLRTVRCARCQTCPHLQRNRCKAASGQPGTTMLVAVVSPPPPVLVLVVLPPPPVRVLVVLPPPPAQVLVVLPPPPVRDLLPLPQAHGVPHLHQRHGKRSRLRRLQQCLLPPRALGQSQAWPPQGRGLLAQRHPLEGGRSRHRQQPERDRQHQRLRRGRHPSSAQPWDPHLGSRRRLGCRQQQARPPPTRGARRRVTLAQRPAVLGLRSCRARVWGGAPRRTVAEGCGGATGRQT